MPDYIMKRFIPYIFVMLSLCLSAPLFAQQEEEPVSKTFRIRFKTVKEFEPLVKAILSNRGQVKSSEELNIMVIVDRPSYLAQITSLLSEFDQPAQQFMIEIQLLLGSDDPKAQTVPDSAAIYELLNPPYFYTKYEELDRVLIRTEAKSLTSFDLAEGQFSIVLDVDYIPDAELPVRFRQFTLSEYVRDISGKYTKPVYTSSAELKEDIKAVFAAIKHEGTGKTLILTVTARRI